MGNTYFTWEAFANNFGKEMVSAEDVYSQMVKSGLMINSLGNFDFHFVSDKKDNLERLGLFITQHYPYEIKTIKKMGRNIWELHGLTNEIPINSNNLLYWGLDMYKRGYEFDSKLDAYGALLDHENPKLPVLDKLKEDWYFEKGIDCYNNGDLSGAIINWSLVLEINPKEPNSYYSRAIVKNELYTWKSAMEDYDKAIEIAPDFISALTNRGTLKDENGDYLGAIEDYNKVIELENVDLENIQKAYFNRGNSKLNLDDKIGACQDWKISYKLGAEYALERINQHCIN
ncbi:hypothetical protein DJ013_14655 [Arcticibacterium luteifluviistationis]|uniref:Uncharacterized protein n=2 Tax=Arcticibacterium luteifluviistationis TaxID=1784714 RepID=A0A2Z4GII7_9BACT|nr:hypothetical protein DJ013_14655 [Arcticibacterium luteifluviistationis]